MIVSRIKKLLPGLALLLVLPGLGHAALITTGVASGAGPLNNSPGLIVDGFVPAETTFWRDAANVWWDDRVDPGAGVLTIDYGNLYRIDDVLLSVDNNDRYDVEYSTDGAGWTNLFTIDRSDGEIPASPGGMDTMSTVFGDAEYVPGIDFLAVNAQYLRIFGVGPDQFYSVGELQAFGSVVPVPAAVWLFGTALAGLFGFSKRRKTA